MRNILSQTLTGLIAILCTATCLATVQIQHDFKTTEIDAITGQWNYNLITKDGTKIKGFFQIEPSNKSKLAVVGQAYFDKDNRTLATKDLRGIWTGELQKGNEQHEYVLPFIMHENPIYPNKTAEAPYHGTIYFTYKNNVLNGRFSDHDTREGISGTINAQKHDQ